MAEVPLWRLGLFTGSKERVGEDINNNAILRCYSLVYYLLDM